MKTLICPVCGGEDVFADDGTQVAKCQCALLYGDGFVAKAPVEPARELRCIYCAAGEYDGGPCPQCGFVSRAARDAQGDHGIAVCDHGKWIADGDCEECKIKVLNPTAKAPCPSCGTGDFDGEKCGECGYRHNCGACQTEVLKPTGEPVFSEATVPYSEAFGDGVDETWVDGVAQVRAAKQDVRQILDERGARYGEFKDHAKLCQTLKLTMKQHRNSVGLTAWRHLHDDQRQALEVIQDKVARILNGDPDYLDNWDDISGYATLVADRLRKG